jgi:2,4-didehydro-3-deoxy-L-rhamnonate hydrolase
MEKPGVMLSNEILISTESFGEDYDESFFAGNGLLRLENWVKNNKKEYPILSNNIRIGPPVKNPGKIVCVGLNYEDHIKESNLAKPKEPILFLKATSAIAGPYDNIIIPGNSKKTDWEVELAVVIGKRASYVEETKSMDYVAGYLIMNDYSEREFQLEMGGQWVKGKSCDTFAPLGPFIATKDEIKDINNLHLWLKVNGELMQNGNTSDLIFKIPFLISYISKFMTLLPGDIISTGTPSGVGLGFKPPKYLKKGDIVELGVDGLGIQKQKLI